jgi:PAS domain S-box-containing protein
MQGKTPTILVVGDDPPSVEMLQARLQDAGYRVETALDGQNGLLRYAEGGVDVVLLDLWSSAMQGLEVCRSLRALPGSAACPILMIAPATDPERRLSCFAAGADDVLSKPLEFEECLARVRVWLRMRQRLVAADEIETPLEVPPADGSAETDRAPGAGRAAADLPAEHPQPLAGSARAAQDRPEDLLGRLRQQLSELERVHGECEQLTQALTQSEVRLRLLVDAASVAIYVTNLRGEITFINRRALEVLGATAAQVIGKTPYDFVPAVAADNWLANAAKVIEAGVPLEVEEEVPQHDGIHTFLSLKFPLRDSAGTIYAIGGVAADITERKRIEWRLQESEERFRGLVETTNDVIWEMNTQGRITYINPAVRPILGYPPEALLGQNSFDLMHEEDQTQMRDWWSDCLSTKRGWRELLVRWRHRDGSYRTLESNAVPMLDAHGQLLGFRGADRDVTERIQAEAALQVSQARYRLLVERIPAITYVAAVDAVGTVLYVSPQVEHLLGFTPEEWQSDPSLWSQQLHPEDRERVLSELAQARATRARFTSEYRVLARDGRVLWFHDNCEVVPIATEQGRIVQGIAVDISARKRAEEELALARTAAAREAERAASEARLRTHYQAMACGVLILGAAGEITDANEAAEEILGLGLDQMRARRPAVLWEALREDGSPLPETDRPAMVALRTRRPVRHVTLCVRRPAGDCRWVQVEAVPVLGPDGTPVEVVGSFIDISARQQVEAERAQLLAAIEQERTTLTAVMASMSDGLVVIDAAHRIRYANARAGELMGLAAPLLLGASVEAAFEAIRPVFRDPAAAWAVWEQGATRIQEQPRFEVQVVGPPPRDVRIQFFPVVGTSGEEQAVGLMLRDVTATKLLARLEERERIAMELHDGVIQSLYGIALGLGAGERRLAAEGSQTRELLSQAQAQIETVIQQVRNYIMDLRPPEMSTLDLPAGLEALAEELRINTLVDPALVLEAEAAALLDAGTVASLLRIAREATSNVIRHAGASRVTIRLSRTDAGVVLTITDNGKGFDQPPATEQGFAGAATGSGQGLRNMAERAKALGGRTDIRSAPGQGTTVRAEVPARLPWMAP